MAGGVKGLGLPFVALLLAATAAVLPITAAYGQSSSFAVTTNKSVYDSGDRVIVAGTVDLDDNTTNNDNDNNKGAKFVTVKVAKDDVICGQQFVRVERDGSFISRPMKVSCGPGDYTVTAAYGSQSATAGFRIADKDAEQSDELAQIHDTVVQARDRANARIKELVQADIPIPTQAVEKYQLGSSEASLAIQSAEYGQTESARKHMDAALAYFAEMLDLLSPENMKALSQPAGEDEERRLAAANDWYGRLGDIYRTLAVLAEKNRVSDPIFDDIQSLLVEAKRLMDNKDLDSAESTLALTESVLDKARAKLVEQASSNNDDDGGGSSNSSNNNNNSTKTTATVAEKEGDSPEARNLLASADRLEKRAEKQLADAAGNAQAEGQIREAINLINLARMAIGDGDYQSSRDLLSTASKTLIDANRLIRSF
ncbi:hypothetical protein [Nitrososphaera viennensis]|uniref:Uncharacterized protein n=2 Tax=Nitrososphaera viennensis TaxID=1034015 RepID=A0A060HFX6_9ARCH|nr:hypothetical protein [Nitrososphaera viennensis]AIC15509.1 exported protein of unknown function [Nitrososphaera viennensis EN76]UVS70396.1 hypothetical protein NWT39_06320 [Nitrososphaera viennensis]